MSCTEECEGRPAGRVEFSLITAGGSKVSIFKDPHGANAVLLISDGGYFPRLTPADLRHLAIGLQDVADYLEISE